MSILVEAACLLVPRLNLDLAFDGGSHEFIRVAEESDNVRFAIVDENLVSVSAFSHHQLMSLAVQLIDLGFVAIDDDATALDFVLVDQETGPTLPCPWLGFERHRHGFTHGWDMRGRRTGSLETPDGWRLEQSWNLSRAHDRFDNADWQHLATENGYETWLDFRTGGTNLSLQEQPQRVAQGALTFSGNSAKETASPAPAMIYAMGRSGEMLHSLLAKAAIPYQMDLEHRCALVPFASDAVDRVQVIATPTQEDRVEFEAVLPDRFANADLATIREFATAFAIEFPGCSLAVDESSRSMHVASSVSTLGASDGMQRLERTLCAAADRAGATALSLAGRIRGEVTLRECFARIRAELS